MGLSQALSAALAGVNVTQQSLSVIAGNVANANTPGYVNESLDQVETGGSSGAGTGVDSAGINRDLNTLLQNQLWSETSGDSYADTATQYYQSLQQIYGTPGSSTSFDAIYNNFTSALQALSTNPASTSQQSTVIGAAQAFAQNLNSMTTTIQQLRTQAEQGIAAGVQSANNLLTQIAQINQQLEAASTSDSASASLEDQRGEDITQLTQLMNVSVVQNPDNQISVFTGTGQQLVAGSQASTLGFDNAGTLSAGASWSANPSEDGAGTITLTSPGGAATDLIATNAIQSGQLGAYIQMRDNVLPQAQTQLDELANQMSQALSNQTSSGATVTSGSQSGYSIDTAPLLPGNTLQLTYTNSLGAQQTVSIVALGAGATLPLTSMGTNSQQIGVDFSAGMSSVVTQLNAALGTNLQFSNPSGTILQALNKGSGNSVDSLSETSTSTSLASGDPQLPLFTDGSQPITGALYAGGSQTTGLAGTITVNPALVAAPSGLVAYAANTAAGDSTRPNFILNQLTQASLDFPPDTGIGSAQAPYSGTLTDYMSQIVSQQSQAANAAASLQQGQDAVLSALQQSFNQESGVNIDTQMSDLIALQNAYGANARVMTTIQELMSTLLQVGT
ncbi:MAG: flagellar hook-associated protein FlgK [Xanthobacteraceae bacterium]